MFRIIHKPNNIDKKNQQGHESYFPSICKRLSLNNEHVLFYFPDRNSISDLLASGYYFGEILHKYQLQDDFDEFSSGDTNDSKLNNYTRLEPTMNLLQVYIIFPHLFFMYATKWNGAGQLVLSIFNKTHSVCLCLFTIE